MLITKWWSQGEMAELERNLLSCSPDEKNRGDHPKVNDVSLGCSLRFLLVVWLTKNLKMYQVKWWKKCTDHLVYFPLFRIYSIELFVKHPMNHVFVDSILFFVSHHLRSLFSQSSTWCQWACSIIFIDSSQIYSSPLKIQSYFRMFNTFFYPQSIWHTLAIEDYHLADNFNFDSVLQENELDCVMMMEYDFRLKNREVRRNVKVMWSKEGTHKYDGQNIRRRRIIYTRNVLCAHVMSWNFLLLIFFSE